MNGELILSKRYATAYIHLFDEQLDLEVSERCAQAADFLRSHHQALLMLKLPTVSVSEQRSCLSALFDYFKLPHSLLKLVDLLGEHNRLILLPAVLSQITKLYRVRHHIALYHIKSSAKLDKEALEIIRNFIEKLSGKKIITLEKVDESLIAGIRLQSDTRLWEYSIQKQLNELYLQHFNV